MFSALSGLLGLSSVASLGRIAIAVLVASLVAGAAGGVLGYRYASGRAAIDAGKRANVYAQETAKLLGEAQQKESDGSKAVQIITTHYEEALKNANTQREKDISDAYSGALRLRIPTDTTNKYLSTPGASACQCDGQARGELPPAVTAGLYSIANDCDAIVAQLTAAQGVIEADRKVCGR